MEIERTGHQIHITCDSAEEAVKVFSLVLAVGIVSTDSFFPSPVAILSHLDNLATGLERNRRVVGMGG